LLSEIEDNSSKEWLKKHDERLSVIILFHLTNVVILRFLGASRAFPAIPPLILVENILKELGKGEQEGKFPTTIQNHARSPDCFSACLLTPVSLPSLLESANEPVSSCHCCLQMVTRASGNMQKSKTPLLLSHLDSTMARTSNVLFLAFWIDWRRLKL